MLLCSQEWQNSLQKHAGLAFIELVNEGRCACGVCRVVVCAGNTYHVEKSGHQLVVAGGWFGAVLTARWSHSHQQIYDTSSPVSTGIGGSPISVFCRSPRPSQPGRSSVGWCNEYRWRRNGELCVAVVHVIRTAGKLAYCMPA